ncbi:MAG: hypothetical protein ABI639_07500 [Thermoanaerobaculia bacterium]
MHASRFLVSGLLFAALALPAAAQQTSVTLGPLACLPQKSNGVLTATVSPEIPGSSTRLYFRRFNVEVEDFYYIQMEPAGGGGYWATFPVPTDSKVPKQELKNYDYEGNKIERTGKPWAEWWKAKDASQARDPNDNLSKDVIRERASLGKGEKRDWMRNLDNPTLQSWLENLETEAGEYFVAVVDGSGKLLGRSEMRSVVVRDDCRVNLTPQQQGFAKNLVIGETSTWQKGDDVFHWECTGVTTRRDPLNVLRADDRCRACVIAWWPVATAGGAVAAIGVINDDPVEISPSRP